MVNCSKHRVIEFAASSVLGLPIPRGRVCEMSEVQECEPSSRRCLQGGVRVFMHCLMRRVEFIAAFTFRKCRS